MKKNLTKLYLLFFAFILPGVGLAQEFAYDDGYYFCDDNQPYDSIDYQYDYRSNKRFNGEIRLGRSFDNSGNFSSGISSYQGTSTGPGPNGGYPGSPRGIYETYYLDNSIYPNSYRATYSR